jgi:uncharacterized phage protein (TIGR01671 family)
MRKMKFRGKRINNGEWVYGYYLYLKFSNTHFILEKSTDEFREVDPATLGQYTGLNDKNGKEIYEGDIARYKQYVVWGKLSEHTGEVKITPLNGVMVDSVSIGRDYEVIGNIYENPELTP